MPHKFQLTFDCGEPVQLAEFWAAALGYQLEPPPDGYASWEEFAISQDIPQDRIGAISAVADPSGIGPRLLFLRVPEPKTSKNRVHLDVNASNHGDQLDVRRRLVDAEVVRLVELGASRLSPVEDMGSYWVVMTDPEGNEFCVQ